MKYLFALIILSGCYSPASEIDRISYFKVRDIHSGVLELIHEDSIFKVGDTIWITAGGLNPRAGVIIDKISKK